ncbi:hypothetical protein Pcinc_029856 [Petrolisthes cinctipes]|uniref:Uncharacterized protein n=1 Tax=Petrolisthes cinctipes TaxID=88211 RepID=A0AAE1F041_PETCI|nr:hypothetical protein Pcinc_029856 [Petrolisthes cinctipes]
MSCHRLSPDCPRSLRFCSPWLAGRRGKPGQLLALATPRSPYLRESGSTHAIPRHSPPLPRTRWQVAGQGRGGVGVAGEVVVVVRAGRGEEEEEGDGKGGIVMVMEV